MPLQAQLNEQVRQKNLRSFANKPFEVQKGEIKNHNFDTNLLLQESQTIVRPLVDFLNGGWPTREIVETTGVPHPSVLRVRILTSSPQILPVPVRESPRSIFQARSNPPACPADSNT